MTDLLDMAWNKIYEASEKVDGMSLEEKEKIGAKALELIGDYPLYGATSNISYGEAIMIALVLGGDDFINSLSEEKE